MSSFVPGSKLPLGAQGGLAETVRKVIRLVLARLVGLRDGTAQRNAWDSTCADLQRRATGTA